MLELGHSGVVVPAFIFTGYAQLRCRMSHSEIVREINDCCVKARHLLKKQKQLANN